MKYRLMLLAAIATLFFSVAVLGHAQTVEASEVTRFKDIPECGDFAAIADRAHFALSTQRISQEEFKDALNTPGRILRDPSGDSFELGQFGYIKSTVTTDGKSEEHFSKLIEDKARRTALIHWYNRENGQQELLLSTLKCINALGNNTFRGDSKAVLQQMIVITDLSQIYNVVHNYNDENAFSRY